MKHPVLLSAIAAIALTAPVPPVMAGAPAELPSGHSSAFRDRMMNWSSPPLPAPLPRPIENTLARAVPLVQQLPRLSSGFGFRRDPIKGGSRMHSGVDVPGRAGTPIIASAPGIVRFAGDAGGYGRMVEIAHGNGYDTRYGHLSRILVRAGSRVAQGEAIGLMGSTGRSTGSHLHFEIRRNGQPMDPVPMLDTGRGAMASTMFRPASRVIVAAALTPHLSDFARRRQSAPRLAGTGK